MNLTALREAHQELVAKGLKLDLTRGKPATAQLDLSNELLGAIDPYDDSGTDTRNYGGLIGLPAMRAVMADILGTLPEETVAFGASSLSLMADTLTHLMLHGDGDSPSWVQQAAESGRPVKMLCPVPGYDRHFELAAHLGMELVAVPMTDHGPDAAAIAELAVDPMVKGVWVVPTYANPTGVTCDEATARALLTMPAASDFRIMWDDAYVVHHLTDDEPAPKPILRWAQEAGHPDRVIVFGSTSKMSFAGAGVAALASSERNIQWWSKHQGKRAIGPDKINQLRHLRFFGNADGIRAHMRGHRELLAPKFAIVDEIFTERLQGADVSWTHPSGGYFITLTTPDGLASRVVELAKEAGVALTAAGSSHPYGIDPRDHVIRLAPSYPSVAELRQAMDVVAMCVLLALTEKESS
ncbi:MAG: aminotransferase class I/II-fold pyridoxal phosphate-dependent enzyme [Propionibacteriaceae bacterium]